jgi:predicted outer membrane repeat protein
MRATDYERKATSVIRPGIRSVLFSILLLTAVLAAYGSALPASAASTITVSTCDSASLHSAIDNAADGDTIVFGCSGTIALPGYSIYEYTILKNLTIDATGQSVTINGGGNTSMFKVANDATLTLNGLTFTGGSGGTFSSCYPDCPQTNTGGAITVEQGTLNVSDSTFTNNISTGLFGGGAIMTTLGTVNVDNSTFSGNTAYDSGGAIQALVSTLTVTNSTFSGNLTRVDGGGINTVSGTATISNSTFTNNTANAYSAAGSGAGVANTGDMTITNSTFSGNNAEAGGAIANQVGTLNVIDSTLVGNHANWWANGILSGTRDGIYLASSGTTTTTLKNTILANGPTRNGDGTFPFGGNCVTNGTLNDGGGNYSDDETCPGSHVSKDDLHLGALASNGGPTQTIALASGSVAINAVACISTINTDQRGFTRSTTGNTCDAGAYEFGAINPIKATTLSAISGSGTYGGTATLTATLKTGSTAVSGKTITFKLNGTTVGTAGTNASGVATLSNVSLSGISGGSHANAVGVSFAGDSGYSSSSGSGTLTVNKVDQTISFDLSTLPAKAIGDPPFDISSYASATSSLTVSFNSSTTSVCTVSGSTVTIVGTGSCTIQAEQTGDGNYNAATPVQQSFNASDTTPPVTNASAVNADNSAYNFGDWTHQTVTITLSPTDIGTGVASTSYQIDGSTAQPYSVPFSIAAEGVHTITFASVDNANNLEATKSITVKLDLTDPTISGAPTTPPNGAGWHNTAVTIHWTCSDALSGVATCPSDQAISTEGTNQTVSGTVTDAAGNQTTVSSSPAVNIDLTAPTSVSGSAGRLPDQNGWYTSPVTITFSGTGDISGIDSCTSTTYSGPDSGSASVPGTCTDKAGNTSAPVSFGFQYDATAPTNVAGTADRTPDSNGWYNHAVGVTFNGQDSASGIVSCTTTSYSGPDSATASVSGSCTDNAGNTSALVPFTLQYDATAPTDITAGFDRDPDSNGWYNHAVTVTFTGQDATSGIGSCTSVTYSGPDTASASITGSCTDVAGNQSASTDASLKYDATAPTNVVASPDRAPNGAGWYNAPVTFTFSGDDATSGIGSCAPVTYSGPDNATASVSGGCTDVAGNPTTVSSTIAYDATAPVIVYTGSAGNYTILQTVSISCAASDNLSGVATTDCQNINALGSTFNGGSNTITSTATDAAGNVGHGSVTFTVTVTADDMSTLTAQYTSDPRVARQLATMLNGVAFAERMHSASMKAGYINMYIMLVNQQRGRALTSQEADTLIRLARSL